MVYERLNRFPARVDYLPNLGMLQLRRASWWGGMRDEFWSLSDVEHIEDPYQHRMEFYYFFMFIQRNLEEGLLFRNKKTGQYFYSDREGVWNWDLLKEDLNKTL